MADREVEDTLREIRERVLAESVLAESALAAAESPRAGQTPNGLTAGVQPSAQTGGLAGTSGDALARLQANLATTERAWSRLPPLLSYRRGTLARLELWLKRQVKRAAHWFTWEQVNFNSAVHHALTDARDALAAHERALAQSHSELASLRASLERMRAETEAEGARAAELRARLAVTELRLDSGFDELRRALAAGIEQLAAEQRGLDRERRDEQDAHIRARAEELQREMRERIEHLLEEQRVCFKQLSLEAAESDAALERARRQLEARIEAVEKSDA